MFNLHGFEANLVEQTFNQHGMDLIYESIASDQELRFKSDNSTINNSHKQNDGHNSKLSNSNHFHSPVSTSFSVPVDNSNVGSDSSICLDGKSNALFFNRALIKECKTIYHGSCSGGNSGLGNNGSFSNVVRADI